MPQARVSAGLIPLSVRLMAPNPGRNLPGRGRKFHRFQCRGWVFHVADLNGDAARPQWGGRLPGRFPATV